MKELLLNAIKEGDLDLISDLLDQEATLDLTEVLVWMDRSGRVIAYDANEEGCSDVNNYRYLIGGEKLSADNVTPKKVNLITFAFYANPESFTYLVDKAGIPTNVQPIVRWGTSNYVPSMGRREFEFKQDGAFASKFENALVRTYGESLRQLILRSDKLSDMMPKLGFSDNGVTRLHIAPRSTNKPYTMAPFNASLVKDEAHYVKYVNDPIIENVVMQYIKGNKQDAFDNLKWYLNSGSDDSLLRKRALILEISVCHCLRGLSKKIQMSLKQMSEIKGALMGALAVNSYATSLHWGEIETRMRLHRESFSIKSDNVAKGSHVQYDDADVSNSVSSSRDSDSESSTASNNSLDLVPSNESSHRASPVSALVKQSAFMKEPSQPKTFRERLQALKISIDELEQNCPQFFDTEIKHDFMDEPTLSAGGWTYDKSTLEELIANNKVDPHTGEVYKIVMPNMGIKSMIEAHITKLESRARLEHGDNASASISTRMS